MTANAPPVVLVDGSSYLYRAFHALPSLTASDGTPTGATLGVINMLNKLIADVAPTHMAVIFDAPGKTFRHEQYAEYKANRPSMPPELREQVKTIHTLIGDLGLPLVMIEGVEADDVIGTLARHASESGQPMLISTGDKDMAQLVSPHVTLVNTMSGEVFDDAMVQKKFGVRPNQIIDYLGLVGDTSDNIPGVPKVGPKTAAKWLANYETAEGVIEHAEDIKGKVGDSLREHIDQLRLSRDLATIKCDVDLPVGLDELKRNPANIDALRSAYQSLAFNTLLRQLPDGDDETFEVAAPDASDDEPRYDIVLAQSDFDAWLDELKKAESFAFDTETTSLDYMAAEIVGVSFAVKTGHAAYVPLTHRYEGAPEQLDRETVLTALKPLLEDADKPKIGHHLKYDAHVLMNHGIALRGIAFDTMVESYVLNSTATRHDMDSVASRYLGRKTVHYEDIAGKGAKQKRFDDIDIVQAGPYAAEDADVTLALHHALWPQLKAEEDLVFIYNTLEQPLIEVLQAMEYGGVLIDTDMLATQSAELTERMAALRDDAYKAAGREFNLGSPKQLQEILFDEQGLPVLRKTPKGQPSTAEDVLQELALDYDLPQLILDYRSLSKLKSTYTDKLPDEVNPRTGRVHTSYHQAVAATGRLSSQGPNLQNIPIRSAEGRRVRQAFVAPEGRRILAADYSQIELRIMAHLSADTSLTTAFAEDRDIHQATAAEVFSVSVDEVSHDQRRSAKAINFGLIYGMSAHGLAKQLSVSRHEAQAYIDLYFERYPGVLRYMDETRAAAHDTGYVETVFGRRLYLPEINSRNGARRQYAERSAINAPMQGTAADIIKQAMISVHRWLIDEAVPATLIMQVHDELVLEVDEDALDEVRSGVVDRMCEAAELAVPLKVDAGVGSNWDEAH
ncbi:MAG: DNA polymerase I [Pseudomonadota bacterium]